MLARQLLGSFSDVVGFNTTFKAMRFSWYDRLVLDRIVIEDSEHNEMISVKRLIVNYKISELFNHQNINLDAVNIDSAMVFFTKIPENDSIKNLNINVFINNINKQFGGSGGGKPPKINIGEVLIRGSQFALDNTGKDSLSGFDYNHFAVGVDEGEIQNFAVIGDTIEFKVNTLTLQDQKTNFRVSQFSTFFRISQQSLEFQNISLTAGNSFVSDTIIFKYESQADLSDFVNKVKIDAHLNNTVIHPADLALFAPAAKRLEQPVILSGHVLGAINNFRFNNMVLKTGNTLLQGSLSMDGLPDFNETFIVLNLKNSKVHLIDLSFLFNTSTSSRLAPLGILSLSAEFLGYPTDFVAKGDFSNQLGRIITDINLKIDEQSFQKSSYRGELSMVNFDLGSYLNDTISFQKVNMIGTIKGSGFNKSTANFTLVSNIKSIGVHGYDYNNITTNATFASQFFNGELKINDPNVKIQTKGSIDLRDGLNKLNLQARIDTLNFNKIHLSKEYLSIHGNVDINTKGFVLDSLVGNAHMQDLRINYRDQSVTLDTVTLYARNENKVRSLELNSAIADLKAEGEFYFSRLFNDIPVLLNEFYLNIRNDKEEIERYYATKEVFPEDYEADFDIKFKNIESIIELLRLDIKLGKNTTISGKFSSGKTTIINAFSKVDSLQYQNVFLGDTEIEISASKFSENPEALVMVFVSSAHQQIGNLKTKDLVTEAIWNKSHIDFTINLDQQSRDNYVRLKGGVELSDSTEIRLLNTSKIQLLEKIWNIDSLNKIAILKKEISIQNFRWLNEQQSVRLTGHISEDPLKKISLLVEDFSLLTINSISQRELSGTVNAEIGAANLYHQPSLQNKIDIQDLYVNNFLVGSITGNNVWNVIENKFEVGFLIDRLNSRIVNCSGYYNPSDKKSPLSITAKLVKANLKIIEPFIDEILSNFDGTISGTYFLTGSLNKPEINGSGKIENGKLMINYLKTTYLMTGTIGLKPNAINFENIELTDALNNKSTVQGEITHQNFNQMRINLGAQFKNFHLLNTSARDNSLFYGQGYASGDVRFDGPLNNLRITANAKTEKNTRVYIPMAGSSSSERKDFINFINFTDSTYQTEVNTETTKKINLTGITFDLNLEVTPDAHCEIIFDIKSGDIIHGSGNGKIKLQLDTKGEFNMFGPVVFTEGGYNFTLYDIINKEFKIEPGSSIAWYGDPYQGTMQINATYNQLASFAPILSDQTLSTVPQIRRKYPVQVLLDLSGPMLSPEIDFDIIAKDLPKSIPVEGKPDVRLEFEFAAFKNKLDEQELKRQVFSLIVLRKFSPPESFNTSGSLVNSVSELFSNQLSYWMSQVDENLEIDVDLGSMDQESFNAFQLRLAYTFLNGRLRIMRDGTFGNQPTNPTENGRSDFSSVVGDWTVDYLLTADGKFKVKMYSRTNVNPVSTNLNSQNAITTGVSLLYTESFNELKDILKSSRNKNKSKPEDEIEINEEAVKEKIDED